MKITVEKDNEKPFSFDCENVAVFGFGDDSVVLLNIDKADLMFPLKYCELKE